MKTYLAIGFEDAHILELRIHRERWESGLFNSYSALMNSVEQNTAHNCYVTLNRPSATGVTNRLGSHALRDSDISRIVRLPFDFDPARPAGLPSTDAELDLAKRRRNALVAMLHGLGWPQPATATSGNGAHAIYRCLLPNSQVTRDMLTALYQGLRKDFSDGQVSFDAAVRNPARIWRLYNTVNRKGTATAERPHRMSTVDVPPRWEGVAPKQIEVLANRYARHTGGERKVLAGPVVRVIGAGDFSTLDVARWFAAHGALKRDLGRGKHAVTCPWSSEHSTPDHANGTDTVIWDGEDGRWPSFHCSHAHCAGRSIRDVMRLWNDADAFCSRTWRRSP